ncbi:pilus assembly protein [Enterobacter cloacae]|nr:pilus assembly protein [Enterobacter cloacae]
MSKTNTFKISVKGNIILSYGGNDSNLLIVFYVQIMPDDFVMQLHRF